MKIYAIREYESFTRAKEKCGNDYQALDVKTFDALKQFILESKENGETEGLELMSISSRKGVGEVITAKNHVGVIAMQDGTMIEILPKIANSANMEEAKELLFKMLKTVKDMPFKTFDMARLDVRRMRVFEVFIGMFISEVQRLVQKGLKSDYVLYQNNERFLKGKLLFQNHLKYNLVHKERFFAEYHHYDRNRPENRLIKTALRYLIRFSDSVKNKKDIRSLLDVFDELQVSVNIEADFNACSNGRDMLAYEQVLRWCEVFLRGNGFTNFRGNDRAVALLFPMEKLFESYVADHLKKTIAGKNYDVRTQDEKYYLFDGKFALRPDIVVAHKENGTVVVLDTKWKLLNIDIINYGISQGDMYQMYAYGKKYKSEKVVLLYPLNEKTVNWKTPIKFLPSENDTVSVHVRFLDLTQERFIDEVVKEFFGEHIYGYCKKTAGATSCSRND